MSNCFEDCPTEFFEGCKRHGYTGVCNALLEVRRLQKIRKDLETRLIEETRIRKGAECLYLHDGAVDPVAEAERLSDNSEESGR